MPSPEALTAYYKARQLAEQIIQMSIDIEKGPIDMNNFKKVQADYLKAYDKYFEEAATLAITDPEEAKMLDLANCQDQIVLESVQCIHKISKENYSSQQSTGLK